MKGNDKVVEELNALLADELTAVSQYMVHSEMCANWGYRRLHEMSEKRAIVEMKHAEELIGRILFLEGQPIVSRLNPINIGQDVPAQLENDRKSEEGAIKSYNSAIKLTADLGDNGTKKQLEGILEAEETHIDDLEAQLDEIKQMGLRPTCWVNWAENRAGKSFAIPGGSLGRFVAQRAPWLHQLALARRRPTMQGSSQLAG